MLTRLQFTIVIGQRSRSQGRYIAFWRYSHNHKNWAIENFQYFFVDTSLYVMSNEIITTWVSREMTSQKIRQYLIFYFKTLIPKFIFLIKCSTKIYKVWQSYRPVLLTLYLSVCHIWWRSDVIYLHFWRVRRLACKRPGYIYPYFDISGVKNVSHQLKI